MFGEIRSDNANAGGDPSNNDQPGWQEFDDFTETNTNTVLHPLYRRSYIGINRVNSLLSNTDTTTQRCLRCAVAPRGGQILGRSTL